MTDRKLFAYRTLMMDQRFRVVSPNHGQCEVVVAAESAKAAAALLGMTYREFAFNGGPTGQRVVREMALARPGVVLVEVRHGVYAPIDALADAAQHIVLDLHDEELHGRKTEHPAFGMVHVNRVSGGADLFMVDYPQDHFITLTISTSSLTRNLSSDRVHAEREVLKIALSEVQWARMVASANSHGVPVTLQRYTDPQTGDLMLPTLPHKHVADANTFKQEAQAAGRKATERLAEAQKRLAEILKGPLRKSDLTELADLLHEANSAVTDRLPFVLSQAHEAIDDATESAKAEVEAHIDFAMQRLGERALGVRLHEALEANVNPAEIGRAVAAALDDKSEPAKED